MKQKRRRALLRLGLGAASALLLAGCDDKQRREKRAAVFGQRCGEAGFTPKQCAFLYALQQDASDRADQSDALASAGLAAANSAAALSALRR
jgi:hypothetical protein